MDASGFDLIAELPDDSSREKEVYARYGLAMFEAQAFERMLTALITTTVAADVHNSGRERSKPLFDELVGDLDSHTAGRLLTRLRRDWSIGDNLDALLRDALRVRNDLAHNFFADNGLDFGTAEGMQRMVDSLDASRRTLQHANAQLAANTAMQAMSTGVTMEQVAKVGKWMAERDAASSRPEETHTRSGEQ